MSVSRLSKQSIQAGFPKQQTVWDQSSSVASMDALGKVVINTAVNSVTFTSIPATYKHLQVRAYVRNSGLGGGVDWIDLRLGNGGSADTTSSYSYNYIYSPGTTPSYGFTASAVNGILASLANPNNGTTSNTFGFNVMDIMDYTNTNKNTSVKIHSGLDTNGTSEQYVGVYGGVWQKTSVVDTVTIYSNTGTSNFVVGSTIALYGIK